MPKRFFIALFFVFGVEGFADEHRPNILVLIADDWSWPHAGALGDPVVKTPTFDRLVAEGVLFEKAFTPAPSCTPSRHAIASGQEHWRLGEGVNLGGSIGKDVPVYPDLLAGAGYVTGFSRKGTAPSKHQFRGSDPFGPKFKNFAEFIRQRPDGQPFCFWYGAGEPHRPYDLGGGKKAGIDPKKIRVPSFLPDNETVRSDLADYYLRIERFDRDAGEILNQLEKRGELDKTLVILTSDNGMPFPRCKATLTDCGTRVPLVIRFGSGGRKISKGLVSLVDLAPTILEAAGLPIPKEMTGKSLLPVLRGTADRAPRSHVLTGMERHVYANPSRAIRTSEFLYIRNFSPKTWPTGRVHPGPQPVFDFDQTPWPIVPGAFSYNIDPGPTKQWMLQNAPDHVAFSVRPLEELYELKSDPDQTGNRVKDPALRKVRDRLSRLLTTELHASGDPRFQKYE
ncbi:MAG: sulfatase [Verrucomicrobiales bacterium]|nr:sulfatase [Verrucomicrobiales bacterium]